MYWQKKVAPAPPCAIKKIRCLATRPPRGRNPGGPSVGNGPPSNGWPASGPTSPPPFCRSSSPNRIHCAGLRFGFFFFGSLKSYICTPTMRRSKVRFARRGHDASLRRQSRQGLRSRWASIRFYCRALRTSILRSGDFYCRDFLIIILLYNIIIE